LFRVSVRQLRASMLRPFTEALFFHVGMPSCLRDLVDGIDHALGDVVMQALPPVHRLCCTCPRGSFCHLLHVASSIHGCFSSNPDQYRTALLTWSRASLLSTCWPGDWFSRARVPTNESSLGGSVYERTL